jgi:hypothetical protein
MQNCAIWRNATKLSLADVTSEEEAVQRSENICNSLGLNYKSAALRAELCRHLRGKPARQAKAERAQSEEKAQKAKVPAH